MLQLNLNSYGFTFFFGLPLKESLSSKAEWLSIGIFASVFELTVAIVNEKALNP